MEANGLALFKEIGAIQFVISQFSSYWKHPRSTTAANATT